MICDKVPSRCSPVAHSHSSSLPPPSAAGMCLVLLDTPTDTTAAHTPYAQTECGDSYTSDYCGIGFLDL